MKNLTNFKTGLFLIILLACVFRLLALDWGLPFRYHDDERNYIETALRIGIGKFEPQGLVHGTLFSNILFFIYALYFLVGRLTGVFASPQAFMLAYLRDPSFFSVIARLVVIIFSLGTLHLTYLIAKKLFNGKTGIFAALFLSFSTVHYMMSTTGLADMVAAFFLLLSFYSLLKYYFRSNALKGMKYFYLSAFFLGLAMAAKLTVVPGIFCFSIIYFLKEKKWNMAIIKRLFLGFLFILLGFFIAEPYPFFNPGKFFLIFDIMKTNNYMTSIKATSPLFSYLFEWLPNSVGRISTFAFFAGVIYLLFKQPRRIILILLFPVFQFLCFQILQATGLAYHLLPGLAFISITTSAFLCSVSQGFKKGAAIFLFVSSLLCIFNPALDSIRYYRVITSPDTRAEAREWIEENIQSGKSIISEGALGNELVLAPRLNENMESLEDSLRWTIAHRGSGRFQKLLIENYSENKGKTYRLYKIAQHFKEEDVLDTQADYLVTSGFFDMDLGELEGSRDKEYYRKRTRVLGAVEKKFTLVKSFEPFPRFRLFYPLFFTADFRALRNIDIFKNWPNVIPGPEIRIYKRIFEEEGP